MLIKEILKESQPDYYKKLVRNNKSKRKQEQLTEIEIRKLMKQRAYKRGTGGAIRQIR